MTAVDVHVRIRIIQPAHENGAQPDISAPTSTRASTAAADRCSYTPGPSNIAMNDPQVAMSVSSRRHRRSMLSMIPRHIVCAHTQDRSVQIPQQSPPKANRGPACLRSLGMRQTTQRLPALAHWKRRVSKQQGPGVAKVQSTARSAHVLQGVFGSIGGGSISNCYGHLQLIVIRQGSTLEPTRSSGPLISTCVHTHTYTHTPHIAPGSQQEATGAARQTQRRQNPTAQATDQSANHAQPLQLQWQPQLAEHICAQMTSPSQASGAPCIMSGEFWKHATAQHCVQLRVGVMWCRHQRGSRPPAFGQSCERGGKPTAAEHVARCCELYRPTPQEKRPAAVSQHRGALHEQSSIAAVTLPGTYRVRLHPRCNARLRGMTHGRFCSQPPSTLVRVCYA